MSETERLVTAEEFARMAEDDLDRYELVEGRLVPVSPPDFTTAGSSCSWHTC
jgi:hypothetical protein